jgi:hypothetical protein
MLWSKVFKPVGQDQAYREGVPGHWEASRAERLAAGSF